MCEHFIKKYSSKVYTFFDEIGVSVPVYAADVSAEIGGDVTCSVTYSSSEMKSYEYTLDRTSKAGYYGIIVVVNADLYNITLERGTKQKTGKLLKFETKEPYIDLYRSDKSF